jgi:predicted nucleic acid-binding protein
MSGGRDSLLAAIARSFASAVAARDIERAERLAGLAFYLFELDSAERQ